MKPISLTHFFTLLVVVAPCSVISRADTEVTNPPIKKTLKKQIKKAAAAPAAPKIDAPVLTNYELLDKGKVQNLVQVTDAELSGNNISCLIQGNTVLLDSSPISKICVDHLDVASDSFKVSRVVMDSDPSADPDAASVSSNVSSLDDLKSVATKASCTVYFRGTPEIKTFSDCMSKVVDDKKIKINDDPRFAKALLNDKEIAYVESPKADKPSKSAQYLKLESDINLTNCDDCNNTVEKVVSHLSLISKDSKASSNILSPLLSKMAAGPVAKFADQIKNATTLEDTTNARVGLLKYSLALDDFSIAKSDRELIRKAIVQLLEETNPSKISAICKDAIHAGGVAAAAKPEESTGSFWSLMSDPKSAQPAATSSTLAETCVDLMAESLVAASKATTDRDERKKDASRARQLQTPMDPARITYLELLNPKDPEIALSVSKAKEQQFSSTMEFNQFCANSKETKINSEFNIHNMCTYRYDRFSQSVQPGVNFLQCETTFANLCQQEAFIEKHDQRTQEMIAQDSIVAGNSRMSWWPSGNRTYSSQGALLPNSGFQIPSYLNSNTSNLNNMYQAQPTSGQQGNQSLPIAIPLRS